MKIKKSNVSTSIKNLVSKGIIEKYKNPNDRRRIKYRLNPEYGWRGDADQWKKEMYNRRLKKVTPLFPNSKSKG